MKVSFGGNPAATWYQRKFWHALGRLKMTFMALLCVGSLLVAVSSVCRGSFQRPVRLHLLASKTGGLLAVIVVV